jgi:hypothetical protein
MAETTVTDQLRRVFATFDAKDVSTLSGFMTDDVALRLGNAEMIEGKAAFVDAVNGFLSSIAGVRHEILNVFTDRDAVAEYRSYIDAAPVYDFSNGS